MESTFFRWLYIQYRHRSPIRPGTKELHYIYIKSVFYIDPFSLKVSFYVDRCYDVWRLEWECHFLSSRIMRVMAERGMQARARKPGTVGVESVPPAHDEG